MSRIGAKKTFSHKYTWHMISVLNKFRLKQEKETASRKVLALFLLGNAHIYSSMGMYSMHHFLPCINYSELRYLLYAMRGESDEDFNNSGNTARNH
ncbi:hypothetical protein J2S25_001791 [Mesobacillus stamsii]|uniref:Uncharacterized protein n=1 Tax=Mesobacillus stamsii TaxID=225347 RepID=A0ABU0FUI3_9BACI|nr:hypothetical protein [Mesobacillus stamsii]